MRLGGETPEVAVPEVLFEAENISGDYEPAGSDGEFLFVEPDDTEGAPLTVVLNWRALLESPD